MSRTLDLLRLLPEAALRSIIAEQLVPGVSSSVFRLGVPSVVSGKDTSIPLEIDRLNVPVDLWLYAGAVDFRYPRLDLGVEFAKFEPEVIVDFPTTTGIIRDALTKRYGILFDEKDFVDQTLEFNDRHGFELTSKAESLRWVGNYPLPVRQRVLELNAAFITKHLGLYTGPVLGNFADLFVAAMNAANVDYLYRPITKTEIQFADPEVADDPVEEKNTVVTVSVTTSDLYKGQVDFFYNRLNLHVMTKDAPTYVHSTRWSEHWEAAIAAAAILGITLTQADVVPDVLPAPGAGVVADVAIQIMPNSKAFTGPLHIKFQRSA